MKIIDYKTEGEMIKIYTDKGNFTYFKNKFKNLNDLTAEINKKITSIKKKKEKSEKNFLILENSLKKKVK